MSEQNIRCTRCGRSLTEAQAIVVAAGQSLCERCANRTGRGGGGFYQMAMLMMTGLFVAFSFGFLMLVTNQSAMPTGPAALWFFGLAVITGWLLLVLAIARRK